MVKVIVAKTRADMRAFFQAADNAGYKREEIKYLKRYAATPLNLLSANGPQAYLVAKRDGKPVFRVLTGVDYRFVQTKNEKTGYFSLLDGDKDEEAINAILDAVMDMQRKWGMQRLIGPVSPDGTGFFMGAGEGDFESARGLFTNPDAAFQCGILRKRGFLDAETQNAFEIATREENPLSDIARKAEERFHLTVRRMKPGIFAAEWIRCICSVSKEAPQKEMHVLLERLRPFIDKKHSYIVLSRDVCLGYLVTLKKSRGILRATTLITNPDHFSAPAVLCLIEAFLKGVREHGVSKAEVSVINSENLRSERLVLRYAGQKKRRYTLFTKNVCEN